MKKTLYIALATCLLSLATFSASAEEDEIELMIQSYIPKLQTQWMEVRDVKSYFSGKYIMPRAYVAVTNLDKAKHGVVTLHVRNDYQDDSQGFSSIVSTYLVDCKQGKQRYVGVTTYDALGNVIGQKFADGLNKIDHPYAFAETPQGHYCSYQLMLNLFTQGGFLSPQDQAKLDSDIQARRERQIQAVQDKTLEIPKVDIEKYQQLEAQENAKKEAENQAD